MMVWRLDANDVARLRTLRTLDDVEGDAVPLAERTEALRLDGGLVDEHVRALVTSDETEALGVVEPLDRTLFRHESTPCCAPHARCGLLMDIALARERLECCLLGRTSGW